MAYVSKVAKDRALWMTPSETLAHICATERCPPKEAQRQIRHALADAKLILRWADSKPIAYYKSGRAKFGMDQPPKEPDAIQNEDHDWLKAKIDWDSGKTHDPQAHFLNKMRRMGAERAGTTPHQWDAERLLLLLKSSVMKLWPIPTMSTIQNAPAKAAPKGNADKKAEKDKNILEAAQELIDGNNSPAQITWPKFCEKVRGELGIDAKGPIPRGYGDDTIENLIRPFLEGK